MISIKDLIKNKNNYVNSLKNRGTNPSLLDELISIDCSKKEITTHLEKLRSEKKILSKEYGELKKNKLDTSKLDSQINLINNDLAKLELSLGELELSFNNILYSIPNIISLDTPCGKDETSNMVIRTYKKVPTYDFKPLDHVELGEKLDIIDLKRAVKVTGARFSFMKGAGALLERALINFMLDTHIFEHGYKELIPPFIVNSDSLVGTGQLPKFEEDLFNISKTNLYLIPTAEVPVTNYLRDEILKESDLPIKFVAYTPCFRSEAGSYGKDTRGVIRQHQFNKVELVKFVHPNHSNQEHDALTNDAETILQKLGLHYRVVQLCSGDIGFSAHKCYDIEVWLPSQNAYREISSCSNFIDFQARRAKIRYKDKDGKINFVHTINGSGLAVGRTVVAIMDQFQDKNGNIRIPEVLKKYTNGLELIS